MPHLQDHSQSKSHEGSGILMGSSRGTDTEDHLPIKDAKTGFFEGTSDPVIAMANKTKTAMEEDNVHAEEVSFDSSEDGTSSRSSSSSTPPAGNRTSKTQVTPSPTNGLSQKLLDSTSTTAAAADVAPGSPKPSDNKSGAPILTIYGNARLFHSPIRVKRRVSHSEDDDEDGSSTDPQQQQEVVMSGAQPAHLRYGGEAPTVGSSRPILIRRGSSLGKRCVSEEQQQQATEKSEDGPATKKTKTEGEDAAAAAMEAAVEAASAMAGMRKKPVISPTSSAAEKGDDNEQQQQGSSYDHRLHPYSYPPPHAHHHGMAPYGHIHPSASFGYGGYSMYPGGYPHHGHYSGFYPPYPSPQASAMHAYRQRPPFPAGTVAGHMPPKAVLSRSTSNLEGTPTTAAEDKGSPKSKVTPSPNTNFKSVSDWQNATMSSGVSAPSANRCVPLKEPVPARYWG